MKDVGILVMAAGYSRRYREQDGRHKLLVRHQVCGNLSLLAHTLQIATAACGKRVNVVLRPEDHALIETARRYHCGITLLESPSLGDSIAAGVAAQPYWSGWLVMLADMPWLQLNTVKRVRQALAFADIVRPQWKLQVGHPVGFSANVRETLLGLQGQEGARSILSGAPPLLLQVDDPGCVRDVDVPGDWAEF
ncbi:nucleotidyltransferase family protein [Pantoea agglomerans]|uniref:Nucleotidyltransferase family protein n=1 Tax=Enterobacter agglomerans TaxID=549 RepID=A0ACC5RPA2_ENTAG|nr:nucleotidyltransferase family protein [Pantoea agglomerans]MBK4726514.1 nucleotidyltransferase family protein [Pantoea agglomerans]